MFASEIQQLLAAYPTSASASHGVGAKLKIMEHCENTLEHPGRSYIMRGINEATPNSPSILTSRNAAAPRAPDPDAPPEVGAGGAPLPVELLLVAAPVVELVHGIELRLALLLVSVTSAHCNFE